MRRYNIYAKDYSGVMHCSRNLTQGKAMKMHLAYTEMRVEHLIFVVKEKDK